MAAVILIVFLAVVAILGGWWLKREKVMQKEDLIRRGKIATGRFDGVVLPKKKPPKRKRKKREANWLDPKYVPPEIPRKSALEAWLKRAALVIDELMPLVHTYRKSAEEAKPVQSAVAVAERGLKTTYPEEAVTTLEAIDWFTAHEERVSAYYRAKALAEENTRDLRKLFRPAREKLLELGSLITQADSWELYKAPEPFHEKLEMVKLLYRALSGEFVFENEPESGSKTEPYSSRRRRKWSSWGEPEPVEDREILAQTRQLVLDFLSELAAFTAAAVGAQVAQTKYREAAQRIKLNRPSKTSDEEVEALLRTAMTWATNLQTERSQAVKEAATVRMKLQSIAAALQPVREAVNKLQEALTPETDLAGKDAIQLALGLIDQYVQAVPDQLKTVLSLPTSNAVEDSQWQRDNASKLRNLMRKGAYAIAQAEAAKASHEAAKAESVSLAEVTPPVLTQSSAAAFANAYTRMTEISARNKQKSEAHRTRVAQQAAQQAEREKQEKQALQELRGALSSVGDKLSPDLALVRTAADLFCSAF